MKDFLSIIPAEGWIFLFVLSIRLLASLWMRGQRYKHPRLLETVMTLTALAGVVWYFVCDIYLARTSPAYSRFDEHSSPELQILYSYVHKQNEAVLQLLSILKGTAMMLVMIGLLTIRHLRSSQTGVSKLDPSIDLREGNSD